ncbi:MAG: putative peptidoglycan glycosyltransferase FtsW [Lachnospiraceae bacterium]|nr:putative peptidoglycan glycosyltransferase FtsW [Lachnospiraceae bacterium]
MAQRKRRQKIKQIGVQHFDYTLLTVVLFLLCIGLVMLYSVSSYDANLTFGDSTYYIKNQLKNTVIGVVAMFAVMMVDYHRLDKWSFLAYIISIVLIALVLTPLGYEANGARRWLDLGVSLQPAEVAKVGVIIYSASKVCRMSARRMASLNGLIAMFFPAAIISIMVWQITDNLSSALIIMGISVVMVYMATPGYKPYVIIALSGILVASLVVFLVSQGILTEELSYRFGRIRAWVYPEAYASSIAFQTTQALYAIGSGGVFGKGLGMSLQKQFVPEAQNDMIFAIICEELGLFGALLIIFLFIVLVWRIQIIVSNATDLFGAMLAVGVMAHISIQVILNLAVVTNTIPNTGISLPFISFGGSSVVFLLIEIGIVLSVAKNTVYDKD